MSYSNVVQSAPFTLDPYLASQTMPVNDLTVDLKYFNVRVVTPVGRLLNCDVVEPRAIKQENGVEGKPRYAITLGFAPGTNEHPIVADLYRAIAAVANAKHPQGIVRPNPQNPSEMIQSTGADMLFVPANVGGFHYPLRSGDEMFAKKMEQNQAYRGLMFVNASMFPHTRAGAEQRPVCLDEQGRYCDPKVFYRGCYARAVLKAAWFESNGNKGVTFYIEAVQFAQHGEKLVSHNAGAAAMEAFTKAGALPPVQMGQPGTGANTAGPGSIPAGFAMPPQPMQQQPPMQQPMQQQPPMQMPANPVPPQMPAQAQPQGMGGFRPPGT